MTVVSFFGDFCSPAAYKKPQGHTLRLCHWKTVQYLITRLPCCFPVYKPRVGNLWLPGSRLIPARQWSCYKDMQLPFQVSSLKGHNDLQELLMFVRQAL